jgi:hypothetical protein
VKAWQKQAVLYVAVLAVVCVAGIGLGRWLGLRKAEAGKALEQQQMQSFFEESVVGLERGAMFPDIPVWSPDGTQAYGIHELLPHGGLLVYIAAGCNSCYLALSALQEAQGAAGDDARPFVVIVDGDPDSLMAGLKERDMSVEFFHDVERSFSRHYHIGIFPTSFVIADGGRLTDMVAGTHEREQFARLLAP